MKNVADALHSFRLSGTATLRTESPEETVRLGEAIGAAAEPATVIALEGPLGVGKTLLTQGIARGLGVHDPGIVSSPTFVLLQEYPGRLPLYHYDCYRLRTPGEFLDLGFLELCPEGVSVIEWAERVRSVLPPDSLWVSLQYAGTGGREIAISATGKRSRRVAEQALERIAGVSKGSDQ